MTDRLDAFREQAARAASGRNATLRPRRPRAVVETDAFAAFAQRIVRAYGRRVAGGDLECLADLAALRDTVDEALAEAVVGLRAEPHAHSWQTIADVLGVTRQAAMQRWPQARGARRRGGQPSYLR